MSPPPKHRTPWHPLFISMMRSVLPASSCNLVPELPLLQGPQRVDAVIVLLSEWSQHLSILPCIGEHLGRHTLLELKSPTDYLERGDYPGLLAYGAQYEKIHDLEPDDIRLMTLSSSLSKGFREKVERRGGVFNEVDQGVYRTRGLEYSLYCIDATQASEREGNGLLYLFTEGFLKEPRKRLSSLSQAEHDLFMGLCQYINQMQRSLNPMDFKDVEIFQKSTEELLKGFMDSCTPEERLRGLDPAERLRGLDPAERLRGLTPEQEAQLLQLLQEKRG